MIRDVIHNLCTSVKLQHQAVYTLANLSLEWFIWDIKREKKFEFLPENDDLDSDVNLNDELNTGDAI
jgi:hypothetical protein